MNRTPALILSAIALFLSLTAWGNPPVSDIADPPPYSITVGGAVFPVKFYDSQAANALRGQFPLTLDMSELNGNEKYVNLPGPLPTAPEQTGDISAGDLMLYGADCLVLFYEGFTSSYSYTKIGYLQNPSGLAAALGSGSVKVTLLRDISITPSNGNRSQHIRHCHPPEAVHRHSPLKDEFFSLPLYPTPCGAGSGSTSPSLCNTCGTCNTCNTGGSSCNVILPRSR